MKRFIYLLGAVSLVLLFAACDVALGSMVNMKGPTVKIVAPALTENQSDITVNTLFPLNGTAEGEDDVVRMEIKLDYHDSKSNTTIRLGREWRYEGGRWQYKPDTNVEWKPYNEGEYGSWLNPDNPEKAPGWNAVPKTSGNIVSWNIPIVMDPLDSGYYFLTVNAWDAPGHHDANSSRKIKVYYINKQPQFEILQPKTPVLIPGKLDGTGSLRNPDVPDVLKTYIYDPVTRPDETFDYIKNWVTDPLNFQWRINDDPLRPTYKFSLELTNRNHLDHPTADKKVYYRFPRSGESEIDSGNGGDSITGIGAAPFDTAETGQTYMQMVTRLEDNAGNVQLKSHGYFAYLPGADKPWVDIKFGYKEGLNGEALPPDAAERFYLVSGITTPVQSWAYGKHLLQKLDWKLYLLRNDSFEPVPSPEEPSEVPDGSANNPWAGSIDLAAEDYYKKGWTFTAEPRFRTGRFRIVVTVYDKEGNSGEYAAYFTIETNATPTVREIDPVIKNSTLFGDENGIIHFKGTAEIEGSSTSADSHTVSVDRVTIAWIKPDSDQETVADRQLKYIDRDYANWNKAEASGFYEDAESKVWEIRNGRGGDSLIFKGPVGNGNQNGLEDWEFSKDLNIFTDLNVGPGNDPSGPHVFLVRALSKNTLGDKSSVYMLNTLGDYTRPEVKINSIIITKYGRDPLEIDVASLVPPNEKLPSLSVNDKIRLKGTWNDDSLQAWKGLDEAGLHTFFRNFKVSWDGAEIKTTLPGAVFSVVKDGGNIRGEWETGDYTFAQSNPDAVVQLYAELTDLNNNRGYHGRNSISGDFMEGEQVFLETDNPTLVRISSTTSDGIYGEHKQTDPVIANSRYVDIFLEFNKQIKFFDGGGRFPPSGTAPSLVLNNNGGRAFFDYGNQENILRFRYFIDGKPEAGFSTAVNGFGGGSSEGKLNVTGIDWGSYPQAQWVSADGGTTPVHIPADVYDPASPLSLAGGKNIVIDKDPPRMTSLTTSAGGQVPHGTGSSIYITATFNETVTVPGSAAAVPATRDNLYLSLKGGNLDKPGINAKARYSNVAGASSVSFLYMVENGHDTSYGPNWGAAISAPKEHLAVKSLYLDPLIRITDEAGNELSRTPALPEPEPDTEKKPGDLNTNLIIDTHKPGIPEISVIKPGNYYSKQVFNITKLESPNVKVEYSLNYDPSDPGKAAWTTVPVDKKILGNTENNYYIEGISLDINGIYNIAAKQSDYATTPNGSADPAQTQTMGPVKIDSGDLLTRIGSSTPDGKYGYKTQAEGGPQQIEIDLEFRIPVYLPAKNSGGVIQNAENAYIALKIKDKNGNSLPGMAKLSAARSNNYTLTFTYEVGENDLADPLDVDSINWSNLEFYDEAADASGSPKGTFVNTWMGLNPNNPNHEFAKKKSIVIMSGYPEVVKIPGAPIPGGSGNYALGAGKLIDDNGLTRDNSTDIGFFTDGGGNGLDIRFNRDIYRGDTDEKFQVRQIEADYRIPAVLSIARWESLFWGRDLDITIPNAWISNRPLGYENTKADYWRWVGETIYQKGSNGAELSGDTLKSDTSVKYVLNYNMDPLDDASKVTVSLGYSSLDITVEDIRNVLRSAEALSFHHHDREVEILNENGKPRILRILFTGNTMLPVKGAVYQWVFPNGFVKDFLDKYNGGSKTGPDTLLSSGYPEAGILKLKRDGVEAPVIRVNKGEDREKIWGIDPIAQIPGKTNNPGNIGDRQAIQPLQSNARIDCRTPGSALTYRTREATDNVGRLIFRDGYRSGNLPNGENLLVIGGTSYALPNIGNQNQGDFSSFNAAKNRPQSGLASGYPGAGSLPYMYNGVANGLNYWTPPPAWPGSFTGYTNTSPVTLGKNNYNDGGMIIHIQARAAAGGQSQDAWEAAYRSVLVFSNANINNNNNLRDIGTAKEILPDVTLGRIFIRGGDSTTGDSSVPDFPLSRDRSLWRKARLLTPIVVPNNYSSNLTITNSNIPAVYDSKGQYLWFWVTWRVNVNVYTDFMVGQLPGEGDDWEYQTPRKEKDFYYGWHRAKEHFPVIPGRTTVVETRAVNSNYADGKHDPVNMGQVLDVPGRRD